MRPHLSLRYLFPAVLTLCLLPSLAIGDITDLPIIGTWPYGTASALLLDGNLLYAGSGGGVIIFDVSGPDPVEVGRIPTKGTVPGLALYGTHLLIANNYAGLSVYDVSDPTSPQKAGSWQAVARVQRVVVNGSYAYLAASDEGVRVIDLNTLQEVDSWLPPEGTADDLHLRPDTLYVSLGGTLSNLAILDASDPADLQYAVSQQYSGVLSDIAGSGDTAYLLHNVIEPIPPRPYPTNTYLEELDVTNPQSPLAVRTLGPAEHAGTHLEIKDGYAYLSSGQTGLRAVDLAGAILDPAGELSINLGSSVMAMSDSTIYLGVAKKDPKGVWLVDVSTPTNPTRTSHAPLPHQAEGVFVSGDHAYIADGQDGLHVIDISDPWNLLEAGNLEEPYMYLGEDLWVTGTEVYVADGTGIAIIDASDPANPVMDTYFDTRPHTMDYWIEGCMRSGDYLYVAASTELRILDVADPQNVSEVAALPVLNAKEVCVDGDHVYVADGKYGMRVVNISDPLSPYEVAGVPTVGKPYDVVVKDGYAYFTDSNKNGVGEPGLGLAIIDVSDPTNPFIVSNLYGPIVGGATKCQGVDIQGDTVYMVTVQNGLWQIDVSDKQNPVQIGYCDTPGAALNVKVRGKFAYVADYGTGVTIVGTDGLPPAPVSAFVAVSGDGSISLSWTNPSDPDFQGVRIRRSDSGYPSSPSDGTSVYDGNGTQATDAGLTNGITYYYAAFAYDDLLNYSAAATDSATPADTTPPADVTGFNASDGDDSQVTLMWTNPPDADFQGVNILRKEGAFPSGPQDPSAIVVYDGSGTTSTDTNVTNGITYYYVAYAYDEVPNYSPGAGDTSLPLPPPPVADFTGTPTFGIRPLTVTFTDQSTGDISTWNWDFGDGENSTDQNSTHRYANAGTYDVSLTVTGPGGSDTKTKQAYITVYDPAVADFTASPTRGIAPLTVRFTDLSTGDIAAWDWDFGDGEVSSDRNPSHVYQSPGMYTVALTVAGPGGSDQLLKSRYIYVAPAQLHGFFIKDGNGAPVAVLTHDGDLILKGTIAQQSTPSVSDSASEFVIKNSAGDIVALIDASGSMLISGTCNELSPVPLSPPAASFVVRNAAEQAAVYVDGSGDVYLTGRLVESAF